MSEKTKKKPVAEFERIYSPGRRAQKYEDLADLTDLLERHGQPVDNFDERQLEHLLNFILHTAKRWDEQIVKMLIDKDHHAEDGAD